MFYGAKILQGENWCWSHLGLKGLKDIQNSRQSGRSKNMLVGKKSRDMRKLVAAANALLILIV